MLSEVRGNPALAAFFDSGRADPFVVTDLPNVAGLRREAIILSLGLGRTPHRRVLHTFGPITAPGRRRAAARRARLHAAPAHRRRVLRRRRPRPRAPARSRPAAARRPARVRRPPRRRTGRRRPGDAARARRPAAARPWPPRRPPPTRPSPRATEPDRLLLDLAERLWQHGLLVEVDHGIPGGDRIPLVVGHPDLPGEMLVAVLTDDEAYVAEPSVRVRDRLTADRLERVGWSVVQVWSAAAFLDPQAEVDRIRRAVHARVPAPALPRTRPAAAGPDRRGRRRGGAADARAAVAAPARRTASPRRVRSPSPLR